MSKGCFTFSLICFLALAGSLYFAVREESSHIETVSQNITVANREMEPSVLSSSNIDRWGAIPGAFNSTFITQIQIQEIDKVTQLPSD
jgi:hypothetical protein